MKKILRWLGGIVAAIVVLLVLAATYMLYLQGCAPGPRPDLARVPVEVIPPAPGYPTMNRLYLDFALDRIEAANIGADHPAPEGVTVERDVVYGNAGNRALKLDLYRPTAAPAKPAPILLFIHGGGWSGGDKRDYAIYCNKFADLGYIAISVGYRLSGEAKFPAAVQDFNAAIRWARANGATYGGDPARIAVLGGSAGGHLSMMVGYASDVPEFQGDSGNPGVSTRVQAVVDLYGPADLTVPFAQKAPQVTSFLGTTYDKAPELFAKLSPITYLDKDDPPTLIIHGTLDDIVPIDQSDLLAQKFKDLGVDYWYDRIDGWPHTLDIVWKNFDHTTALIQAFLNEKGLGLG